MGMMLQGEYDFIGIVNCEIFKNKLPFGFYCTECQGRWTNIVSFTLKGPANAEIRVRINNKNKEQYIDSIIFNDYCSEKVKATEYLIRIIGKKSLEKYAELTKNLMNDMYPLILKCSSMEACQFFRKEILKELERMCNSKPGMDVLLQVVDVTVSDKKNNYAFGVSVEVGGKINPHVIDFYCGGIYVVMDKETASIPIRINDIDVDSLNIQVSNVDELPFVLTVAIENVMKKYRFIPEYI